MNILTANQTDLPLIAALYTRNWKDTYKGFLPDDFLNSLTIEKAIEKWQQYLLANHHTIFTAYDQSIFWGFAACKPDHELPDCIYLDSLHIAKEARGQGAGTQLIRKIASDALARGYKKMSICIIKGNDNARRLYTKLGAVHYKDFNDDFHGTLSNSEKLIWEDLSALIP